MKKKIIIPLAIFLLFLLVLFLPIPRGSYEDGGTREYRALTYKIVRWNKINAIITENGEPIHSTYRNTSLFWFKDKNKTIDQLWKIEMETEEYKNWILNQKAE